MINEESNLKFESPKSFFIDVDKKLPKMSFYVSPLIFDSLFEFRFFSSLEFSFKLKVEFKMDAKKPRIDYPMRWKKLLMTNDRKSHKIALSEMLQMLNIVDPDIRSECLKVFVHNDMTNFIIRGICADAEMIRMANKIIFLLCEQDGFIKLYFNKVVQAYSRNFSFLVDKYARTKQRKTVKETAEFIAYLIKWWVQYIYG